MGKRMWGIAIVTLLVMALGLVACAGSSGSSSATTSGSASASDQASLSSSSSSAAESAQSSGASASASPSTVAQSASAAPSANAAMAPAVGADGKQTATGTVVTTTYKERAADVGLAGDDYANDTGLLTLLVLDSPIQVTAYKGGSDYTGAASVICLPNDEMFRQFSGKQITISVDTWGEWPADLSGKLYDLVVDFSADGLDLVES